MRRTIALAITAATTAGLAAFVPATANAATSGSTPVTFTLTGGAISLTVPSATATLAGGALTVTGSTVTGQLGSSTVTDARGLLTVTDTVTMSSSDFTSGANTILATGNATGYSGVATPSGTGVPVPTLTGQSLSGAGSTILTVAIVGSGGATYNPTVSVAIPAGAVAGVYTGTVTQSVS